MWNQNLLLAIQMKKWTFIGAREITNDVPVFGVIDVVDGAVSVAAAVPPAQLVVLPLALVVARGRSHTYALLRPAE